MDALSAILSTHQVRGAILADGRYHAPWGIEIDQPAVAGFHIVVSGTCLFRLEDGAARGGRRAPSTRLHQGDVVVIPNGVRHVLADNDDTVPVPLKRLEIGSGTDTREPDSQLVCGAFEFPRGVPSALMSSLPPAIILRGPELQRDPLLGPLLRLLLAELGSGAPGAQLLVDRLTDAVFVGVIRAHLAGAESPSAGWLLALRDDGLAKALAAIHARPQDDWSVPALAKLAGMSRATFARRFDTLVGQSPASYLQGVRLERARHLLHDETRSVAEVAAAVGYASAFSFSRTFKKAFGHAPSVGRSDDAGAASAAEL